MWSLFILWDIGLTSGVIPTLSVLLIFAVAVNVIKHYTRNLHIPIRDASKQHSWCDIKLLTKPCYCSVCAAFLVTGEGVYCDCCGVCADTGCIKKADRKLKCKAISYNKCSPMPHHWVKGNLHLGATCEVCAEECGSKPGLTDWSCVWCQRIVHSRCKPDLEEVCDYGKFHHLIIPPSCVTLTKKKSVRRELQLLSISHAGWDDWTPLIVLANRKSGNNDGGRILSLFRRLLNPAQVVDLADRPPEAVLEWCSLLAPVKTKLLVAGGDGTVGWVLNAVHRLKLDPVPAVAILPLGTGNDLSRVLGWGKEHSPDLDPSEVLQKIEKSTEASLDRWKIDVCPYRHLAIRRPIKSMFMYNYFSIGVDAQVTLDFHRTRESPFYLFSSRIFNKLLYLSYGTQQVMERSHKDLEKRIEIYLDGKIAELPAIESVVILNIPSWGAGVYLWNMGADSGVPAQSFSDGKLEVVALYSSFHIAQLQMGMSQPHRVGQASHIQIKLKEKTAVQVDGEPWEQYPGEINVTFQNQASVLKLDQ